MSIELKVSKILADCRGVIERNLVEIGIDKDKDTFKVFTDLVNQKIQRDVAYINNSKLRKGNVIKFSKDALEDLSVVENCIISVLSTLEEFFNACDSQSKERNNMMISFLKSDPAQTLLPYEICPDKWKAELQKQESINDHVLTSKKISSMGGAYISCRKCKGKNCICYTLQTRSADEGMTTIIFCKDCNHSTRM